jgi:DNA-binding LacI/PurR family transcriptional regulator
VEGLQKEARKKRLSLTLTSDLDEIDRCNDGSVMIVGAETEWLNLAVKRAKNIGKHPIILSNQSESDPKNGVSRVTEDIFGSMNEIMDLFATKGYENVALYAHNPDSASDSFKKEAFLKLGGHSEDIYINKGSLESCFDHFHEKHAKKRYGGIVCANDFAAISLIRHLKNKGEDIGNLDIISYSNTLTARCTSPRVSTVKANFKSFGQLAFLIVDCISKGENISGIRIFCDWEIIHRETSSPAASGASIEPRDLITKSGSFYEDRELMEMMRIENLLSECDETDLEIIEAILGGKKTADIQDCCYLTETAVKYRIKKMKDICLAESRAELKGILSKYLSVGIDKSLHLEYN